MIVENLAARAKNLGVSLSSIQSNAEHVLIDAIHQAGKQRVQDVLNYRADCEIARQAWRTPGSIRELIERLAQREGGLLPLVRCLKLPGLKESWLRRLRAIARGEETPSWPQIQQIARAGEVVDLSQVHRDWAIRYRAWLTSQEHPPLAIELRLLIAEVAPSLRAFSSRVTFGYPVLIRDLQHIGRQQPLKWFHVERLLRAAGLSPDGERWHKILALWRPLEPRRNGHVEERPWLTAR